MMGYLHSMKPNYYHPMSNKILAPKKRLSNTSYWKRGGVVCERRDNEFVKGGGGGAGLLMNNV